MSKPNRNNLLSDRPLVNPEHDRLGVSSFAKHVSSAIKEMSPVEGLVISIQGEWGSGKTTIINFIDYFLSTSPINSGMKIIYFNPWWFPSSVDLAEMFFDQIKAVLKPSSSIITRIRGQIFHWTDKVSKAPIPYKEFVELFSNIVKPKKKNIAEIKNKLGRVLAKQSRKYVVIIDDIDRLTASEIRQLFRVIKAVANLPNIIYLLAFDRVVVASALDEIYPSSGEIYLEKIIQVPFEIPKPDKTSINKLLFEKLDIVLGDLKEQEFDNQYWGNLFWDGIEPLINTPRDVARLFNALSVTCPAVRLEVNPVDFISIEVIRIFLPGLFFQLRDNPDKFALQHREEGKHKEELLAFHNFYLEKFEEGIRNTIKLLIQRLFPQLQSIWGNTYHGDHFYGESRRNKRICCREILPVYFQMEVPEGAITFRELDLFIRQAASQEEFASYLVRLSKELHPSGVTRAHAILERLEDYTEKGIPGGAIRTIILAIYQIADALWEAEPDPIGFNGFGVDVAMERIAYQLLIRLDSQLRFDLLCEAINNSTSLGFIEREVGVFGQMLGKYGAKRDKGEDKLVVNNDQHDKLALLASERFFSASVSGSLISSQHLAPILRSWQEWSSDNKCEEWLRSHQDEGHFLVSLITSVLSVSRSYGIGMFGLGDRVSKSKDVIQLDFLSRFIDLDKSIPVIVKSLEESKLTDRQLRALKAFTAEMEKRRNAPKTNVLVPLSD